MKRNRESDAIPGNSASLAAIIAILFPLFVWNTEPVRAEETRPCAEEIRQFCKDIKPGGGRLISCLKSHENELAPVCKDKLQEVRNRLENAKRICANDIEKFCRGVQEGEGRIAKCLGEHGPELSPQCSEQVEWVKAKTKDK